MARSIEFSVSIVPWGVEGGDMQRVLDEFAEGNGVSSLETSSKKYRFGGVDLAA